MKLSLFIARRYLISKKTHNAINLISLVSVLGVMVAVAAMICTLSVYNGFQQLLGNIYSSFDPQIKIKPAKGKTFVPKGKAFEAIQHYSDVQVYCETLEENALLLYKEAQTSATIKGVEPCFAQLTRIDSLMIAGHFVLQDANFQYATLGVGLASILGTGNSFIDPVTIYVPKRTASINLAYPASSFKSASILICGTFGINQSEYDDNYVIVPLSFARDLFEYTDEVTSIDIKLRDKADVSQAINTFKKMLGPSFQVLSMTEQKAELYRINRIEKWMTFLILSFILLIALFNIIGSLSMLILDKQKDARTLSELGANSQLIRRIFLSEGWLIAFSGAILGIVAGIILCFFQQQFGLLKLGGGGNYIIDYYPVKIELRDVLLVLVTTLVISFPATWWPVNQYFSKYNKQQHE